MRAPAARLSASSRGMRGRAVRVKAAGTPVLPVRPPLPSGTLILPHPGVGPHDTNSVDNSPQRGAERRAPSARARTASSGTSIWVRQPASGVSIRWARPSCITQARWATQPRTASGSVSSGSVAGKAQPEDEVADDVRVRAVVRRVREGRGQGRVHGFVAAARAAVRAYREHDGSRGAAVGGAAQHRAVVRGRRFPAGGVIDERERTERDVGCLRESGGQQDGKGNGGFHGGSPAGGVQPPV